MARFAVNAYRKQYARMVIEAESLEEAEAESWNLDEEDFDWIDSFSMDIEVEELD